MNAPIHITDILIIGGGLAGMQCALYAGEHRVTLVDGGTVGESGASPRAKGGVAVPVDPSDHPKLHADDTLSTGDGLCDHGAVQVATEEGVERLRGLLALGVPFDCTDSGGPSLGSLSLGQEAAHSRRRIVRAGGDSTGKAICETISQSVRRATHIALREGCQVVDLITNESFTDKTCTAGQPRVVGAWIRHADGHLEAVLAHCTVLATGGSGQLFAHTSNPAEALGSGLALAHRAGASLVDLEFVQFHPTALAVNRRAVEGRADDKSPLPLLSEAIRGEGATLVDDNGHRFMCDVHPDAELAPRDVVARTIWHLRRQGEPAFLDATALGESFYERFPAAYADCKRAGLDPARDRLPVTPAAHYHMGGVAVDLDGRTSLPGLWACGEVASTGLHGANRLASNSLLEALVFGRRAALSMTCWLESMTSTRRSLPNLDTLSEPKIASADEDAWAMDELREVMWRHVGLVRNSEGLGLALETLDRLAASTRRSSSVNDAVTIASLIALAALRRCESRGAHFRSDHPQSSQTWRKRLVFGRDGISVEPLGTQRCFGEDAPKARRLPW